MTFTTFSPDDIVAANPAEVTMGIWTNGTGSLTSFYTSSTQAASLSGQYYYNVYDSNPTSSLANIMFAIAYGNRLGGGCDTLALNNTSTLSTTAIYSQYRNLLLDPSQTQFTFGNYLANSIWVINLQRTQLKEQLDPGNWLLQLSGSNGLFTFIDDSLQTLGAQYGHAGAVFNVVSGSLTGVSGSTIAVTASSQHGGFGLVYPGLGLIVLHPSAIADIIGMPVGSYSSTPNTPFMPVTSSTRPEYNQLALYNAMKLGGDFQARSSETISSTHYFVRLRNKELNYSNNPTFFDETSGNINNTDFILDPRVYPTTVGLYNDQNELVAVAKLSKPVQKSFSTELLIKCRLDY